MSSGDASDSGRPRRSSFSTQAFAGLFNRPNGTSTNPPFPTPIVTAASQDSRRRMSITGVGLSASPTQAFGAFNRRSSVSTAGSESIDECAVEDDDFSAARMSASAPFSRRMSFGAQALRSVRTGTSPGNGRSPPYSSVATLSPIPSRGGRGSPPQASKQSMPRTASDLPLRSDEGFDRAEQSRARAESLVSQAQRPYTQRSAGGHERAHSMAEMPAPPNMMPRAGPAPTVTPVAVERPKPDAIGERILRGQFMMD